MSKLLGCPWAAPAPAVVRGFGVGSSISFEAARPSPVARGKGGAGGGAAIRAVGTNGGGTAGLRMVARGKGLLTGPATDPGEIGRTPGKLAGPREGPAAVDLSSLRSSLRAF